MPTTPAGGQLSHEGLQVAEFADLPALRTWLAETDATHPGVWVRLRKARSTVPSITFRELLEEGIAFGWSESTRHAFDDDSYLQRFGPRRHRGTASERNLRIAEQLETEERMTDAGRRGLGR